MRIAPHRHRPGHEAEDLVAFLTSCREAARAEGEPVLACVSLAVRHIDPFAVLLATRRADEPWFYRECPARDAAIAAIGAAERREFRGVGRTRAASAYIQKTLTRAIVAGETGLRLSGPVAFVAAEFEPDGVLAVTIPARMVTRIRGAHLAVANVVMTAESDPGLEARRLLSAHARFAAFDYAGEPEAGASPTVDADIVAGEAAYAGLVGRALGVIESGAASKIVVARRVDAALPVGHASAACLDFLRTHHASAHTYSFSAGDGVEWLGATPETLLSVREGVLHTEALAGTGPRAKGAGADAAAEAALLDDGKVLREQRAVTDAILDRLRGLGLDPEEEGAPRVLRLPHTRHLLTPVRARLVAGVDALRVAEVLHPTPAVCGTPTEAAAAFIREHEGAERSYYAGYSGWVDARGEAHLMVNLRCARLGGGRASLYAGAGIVAGSVPADEAAETTLKLRTVAEALGA